jgi:hypothetical protein
MDTGAVERAFEVLKARLIVSAGGTVNKKAPDWESVTRLYAENAPAQEWNDEKRVSGVQS